MMRNLRFFTVLLFFVFCAGTLYAQTEVSKGSAESGQSNEQVEKEEIHDDKDTKSKDKNKKNKIIAEGGFVEFSDIAALWPSLVFYGGTPEYLSFDAGYSLVTHLPGDQNGLGPLFLYGNAGIGTDFKNANFRFSGGFGVGFPGPIIRASIGGVVELSPGKKTVTMGEITWRILFINLKWTGNYTDGFFEQPQNKKFYVGLDVFTLFGMFWPYLH
ncbi:MAG: hypothetical protein J6X37_02510 [Treponema sp.]|nr:hypothetical protein [Treponema sp.]